MTQYERELTNLQALELIPDEEIRNELIDLFLYKGVFEPDGLLFGKDDEMFNFLMKNIKPGAYGAAAVDCMFSTTELGGEDRYDEIMKLINVSPHDSN